MKVLVTGAAGYIGSTLCRRLLEAGHSVLAYDSLLYDNGKALLGLLGEPRFAFVQGDVRRHGEAEKLAEGCEGVIPLAAIVGASACDKWPTEAAAVNRDAVYRLARSLSPAQRLVSPNTNSGYGRCEYATEDSPLSPLSLYGRTKVEAEKYVLDHPNAVSLRLATVFGASPRMRFDLLVNDWTYRAVKKGSITIYQPHFRRNFIHVRDVADAFLHALEGSMTGPFNVGNPACNLTKRGLADRIGSVLGVGGWAEDGEGEDPDGRDYYVSNDRAEAAGFRFARGLDEGILEAAQAARMLSAHDLSTMRNG